MKQPHKIADNIIQYEWASAYDEDNPKATGGSWSCFRVDTAYAIDVLDSRAAYSARPGVLLSLTHHAVYDIMSFSEILASHLVRPYWQPRDSFTPDNEWYYLATRGFHVTFPSEHNKLQVPDKELREIGLAGYAALKSMHASLYSVAAKNPKVFRTIGDPL